MQVFPQKEQYCSIFNGASRSSKTTHRIWVSSDKLKSENKNQDTLHIEMLYRGIYICMIEGAPLKEKYSCLFRGAPRISRINGFYTCNLEE